MQYRHEWKHEINYADLLTLRMRLAAVMHRDTHAEEGIYRVRSLYFDNLYDKALREKIDGVDPREKFRLRLYNGDATYIVLEKKSKYGGLCAKESCRVSAEETERILCGDRTWMGEDGRPLLRELCVKMKTEGLRPKTVVDYTREPFVFAPGNVRVTLDRDIRTGVLSTDFLNTETLTVPAGDAPIILEVKWDAYLPDIIRDAVSLPSRRVCSFSKYQQCRLYG